MHKRMSSAQLITLALLLTLLAVASGSAQAARPQRATATDVSDHIASDTTSTVGSGPSAGSADALPVGGDRLNSRPDLLGLSSIPALGASTAASSNTDCTTWVTEDITQTTTWTLAGSPYCLHHYWTIHVQNPTQAIDLTIEPGVVVKGAMAFQPGMWCGYSELVIGQNAALHVAGTAAQPVVFTRQDPEGALWGRVVIGSDSRASDTIIEHALFEYGGTNFCIPGDCCFYHVDEMLQLQGGSPTVRNSTFEHADWGACGIGVTGGTPSISDVQVRHNGDCGIYVDDASPTIENSTIRHSEFEGIQVAGSAAAPNILGNTIEYNETAVSTGDGAQPTINYNTFYSNTLAGYYDGVENLDDSVCVDAQHNYWGDPGGPHDPSDDPDACGLGAHENPDGDSVTDNVDYMPYAQTPSGATTTFDAPSSLTCEDLTFEATLWVTNTGDTDFQGGSATISLPAGLDLEAGEPDTKSMGDVPARGAGSVSWQIEADGSVTGTLPYSATTTFTAGSGPLTAQTTVDVPSCGPPPLLYIDPASATTTVSGTTTVDIRVRDVTDLYGVQLYLSFDHTVVEVEDAIPGGDVNIEPGDFLINSVVSTNYVDNDRGMIEYVQTQEGAIPGASGDGVLGRITFHGKAVGTSDVGFTTHILGDPTSVPIAHDVEGGEIVVQGTGSVSGGDGPGAGGVILERRVNYPNANAGATVELAGQSDVTGDDGAYSFDTVPVGTHRITVTHPSYLPAWRTVEVIAGETTTLPDVELLGGDCDTPQGIIDGLDATTMGLAWDSGPGDGHWNSRADVRDDSTINVLDLNAVKFNWLRTQPGPWTGAAASTALSAPLANRPESIAGSTSSTAIVLSPAVVTTSVGVPAVVEVWIQDVEGLYGGGFDLRFDPGVVGVWDANSFEDGVQIESGSWLKRQLEVVHEVDNTSGQIDFFVSQRHPETAKNGSGVLARITLVGKTEGSSTLHFEWTQLADDEAEEIPATAHDGTVVVQAGYTVFLPVTLRSY